MKLIFLDGYELNVADTSTITGISFNVEQYADLDTILAKFTPENMLVTTLGEVEYHAIIPESVSVNHGFKEEDILVYVACRTKTDVETMGDEISELQAAVIELAEMIGG